MILAEIHFDLNAWEWAAVGLSVLAVAWTVQRAVRLTIRPGEDDPRHLKRSILEEPEAGRAPGGG